MLLRCMLFLCSYVCIVVASDDRKGLPARRRRVSFLGSTYMRSYSDSYLESLISEKILDDCVHRLKIGRLSKATETVEMEIRSINQGKFPVSERVGSVEF